MPEKMGMTIPGLHAHSFQPELKRAFPHSSSREFGLGQITVRVARGNSRRQAVEFCDGLLHQDDSGIQKHFPQETKKKGCRTPKLLFPQSNTVSKKQLNMY